DDLHLVVLLEGGGEAQADVAAAGDDDAARRVVGVAQFAHDAADVVARGQEEYLIPLLHHRVALGRNGAPVAVDGDHAHLHLGQVARQFAQALTDQQAVALRATLMSASPAPALSSTVGWAALPATVRTSSRSCRSRSTSSFTSTTVTSLASSRDRWSAAVRPT